ncbi:MAG TPA: hypothetical protein VIK55_03885 [Paludibacter sp.]
MKTKNVNLKKLFTILVTIFISMSITAQKPIEKQIPSMLPASEDNDRIAIATIVCKKFYANCKDNIINFHKQSGQKILLTNEYPIIFELSENLTDNSKEEEEKLTIDNIEMTYKIDLGKLLFSLEQSKSNDTPIKVELKNGLYTPNTENTTFNITQGNSISSKGYYLVNGKRLVFLNGGLIFNNNDSQGEYRENTEIIFDGVKYGYKSKTWTKLNQ